MKTAGSVKCGHTKTVIAGKLLFPLPWDGDFLADRPQFVPLCAICGKPCDLETCKITYDGKPVHEECLVRKLTERAQQKP